MPTHTGFTKRPYLVAIHMAIGALLTLSPLAHADPQGGVVVGGTGSISQAGTNTTIHQQSQNMAINWQSFNVNTNETVTFVQPNSDATALNRILSNNGSTIAGRIDANGRVILVNPNGIFFTPTASLNVGSLIAAGLDINPDDFMNGHLAFHAIDGTNGTVINQGIINASLGGNAALIGKQVRNDGVIVANLGTVTLAAGKEAILTFDNQGLLGVKVTKAILQEELGLDPAVINNGTIQAQGGKVLLTASQSQDLFSQAVNTTGLEQATSVVVHPDGSFTLGDGADVQNTGSIDTSTTSQTQGIGRIVLLGQNVTSSGTINANAKEGNAGEIELHAQDMTLLTDNSLTTARAENGEGGTIKVLGDKVGVFDQSTIDVSGSHGGGKALIGGDFQGKNSNIRNASHTIVDRHTRIYADATHNGNGGEVIVWADGTTQFLGNIFTRGGAEGGNGGFVEVSGKESLYFDGVADRGAVNGRGGMLLLDPRNINIVQSGNNNNEVTDGVINFTDGGTGTDYTISASALEAQIESGDVTLEASQDINVTASLTAVNTASAPNNLVLRATDDITFDAAVTLSGVNVTATAGYGCTTSCLDHNIRVNSTSAVATNGANVDLTASGNIVLEGDITTNNGNFTAVAANGHFDNWFTNQNITAGTGAVSITTGGAQTYSGFSGGAFLGDITAGSLSVVTSGGGITQSTSAFENLSIAGAATFNAGANAIDLQNASNNLQGTVALTSTGTGNNVILRNDPSTGTTTLGATTVAGNLTINADNSLTLAGNVTADNVTLTIGLDAGSTFTANTAVLSAQSGTGVLGTIAISGNSGNDSFNLGTNTATTVNGNGGTDTLVGGNQANNWQITAANAGTLNTSTAFSNIERLTGGSAADTFTYATTPTTANIAIDGAGGSDTAVFNTASTVVLGGDYVSIETFTSNAASTLVGADTTNTWTLTGTNAGTLNDGTNTTTFSGFNLLIGGNQSDTFTLNTGGSAGTLNGGGGTDTLVGQDTATNWTLTGTDSGSLAYNTASAVFTAIENLTGGSNTDSFTTTSGTVTGLINGGAGTDSLLTAANTTVQLGNQATANLDVYQVESITAAGAGTLIGDNTANTWTVSTTNGGTVSDGSTTTAFAGFTTLTGGTAADQFVVASGASTGTLNGGDGADSFTLAGTVVTLNGDAGNDSVTVNSGGQVVTVNLGDGNDNFTIDGGTITNRVNGDAGDDTFTLASGNPTLDGGTGTDYAGYVGAVSITVGETASGLEGVNALNGNGTLNAQTGANTTWTIDGYNTGSLTDDTNETLAFTGFTTLNGSDGNDTFNITTNTTNNTVGSLTGAINGNGGTNALNVTLSGNEIGQVNYVGNTGTDTMTVTGTSGTYNASYTPDATTAGDQLHYVSSTNATYTVNYQGVDTVQTHRPLTTLTVNGTPTNDTITLNNGSFSVNANTSVNYTNVTNLSVNTQAGTDTIALNGLNLGSGSVTLTAEQVTGSTPSTAITAQALILQDIGAFGSQGNQIQTSLNTLTLANAGDVHLNEANGLTLNTSGNTTNAGQFTIDGTTTFNTGTGGSLTLNNPQNDFDTLDTQAGVTAQSISLTDANRLEGGNLTAQAITLNTQTGIGSEAQALTTHTANLTVHNGTNGVYVHNDQALNANITNRGDIHLTNLGNLTVERLYANGDNYQSQGPYAGDVVLNVQGHINAYQGPGAHSATSAPDIVAENLTVTSHGDFGNPARAMSILVNNTFAFFGQRGYVFYYGQRPQFTIGADDLVLFSGLTALQGQQLIEIESLEDIDPAIFTAVRNYYHEDVAILMPEDQRIGDGEEEREKEKQGTSEIQTETQEGGALTQQPNKVAP